MKERNSMVAVYTERVDAVQALNDLQASGFDMTKLSLVAKTNHLRAEIVEYYKPRDHAQDWGNDGRAWEDFRGLFASAAFFSDPGIGPILMAGPLASNLVASLDGVESIEGLRALGTTLYNLGIAKHGVRHYQSELGNDRLLLLITHCTANELLQIKEVLHKTRPDEVAIHFGEAVGAAFAE